MYKNLLVCAIVCVFIVDINSAPVVVESGREPSPQCDPEQEYDCERPKKKCVSCF